MIPRQRSVCPSSRRSGSLAEESVVELGRGQPLEVHDVRMPPCEPREADRVLEQLDRDAEPRAAKEARADGIEELAPAVAVRRGRLAETERRGDELDVCARPREGRGQRIVVLRREGWWVGEQDAHRT